MQHLADSTGTGQRGNLAPHSPAANCDPVRMLGNLRQIRVIMFARVAKDDGPSDTFPAARPILTQDCKMGARRMELWWSRGGRSIM